MSGSISCCLGDITQYVDGKIEKIVAGDQEKTYIRAVNKDGYTERINKNSRYSREVEKYNAWREFAVNGNLKLLKDYKGNAWVIQIVSSPTANINMQSNLMQTVISFEWQEAIDFNKIRIVSSDR